MPFDGTTIAAVVHELSILQGGRIDKITQPEADEILLAIRAKGANHRILLTANSNAPRLGFTVQNKPAPAQAPMFCMVLRKHLSGGRVLSVTQPDFERIVELRVESLDEMGDKSEKILLIEIMGKHSNIILLDRGGKVLDAIKHVPPSVSLARPILQGAVYSRPPTGSKVNPLEERSPRPRRSEQSERSPRPIPLQKTLIGEGLSVQKAIYQGHTGISPVLASEICTRADIAPEVAVATLSEAEKTRLGAAFGGIFEKIRANEFDCRIYWSEQNKAVDLAVFPFSIYAHFRAEDFESPSAMLEAFYSKRDEAYRISQKTADLRKLINAHLERCRKKSFVYEKTLREIENRDALRVKGELLTAYLYMVENGAASFTAQNFYENNTPIEIALDAALSPAENAQKYFKQYNKQKRAFAALQEQIVKNTEDLTYLESVAVAMETVENEADIAEIRAELAEQGFAKKKHARFSAEARKGKQRKAAKPEVSKPLRFTSSDGFEIYVGKNNTQNDYLTLRFAKPSDIWFHTKDIAGSHVILVTGGAEPTEAAIREAANFAALNSRAKESSQVPVDYAAKKHVRKPAGAKPGYVIYDRYKTIFVTPAPVKFV